MIHCCSTTFLNDRVIICKIIYNLLSYCVYYIYNIKEGVGNVLKMVDSHLIDLIKCYADTLEYLWASKL